ncbi:MAG: hypothetical protein VKJ04_02505 [Vampirovibrionales bacterium]|nr:hypothetical protein [Vampirovibrionales bacterium]
MSAQPSPFFKSKQLVMTWFLLLLFIIIAIETFFLYQQHRIVQEVEAQSARMLDKFLSNKATPEDKAVGVPIRLQNVKFHWSNKVFINTGLMATKAVPISGKTVNFDNLDSFLLNVQKSDVLIRPSVLEGMFNESVFNYQGSKLRDLKVTILKGNEENKSTQNYVKLSGSLDYILWIPFEMLTQLSVDKKSNTLVIDVEDLKIFGLIPANKLIEFKPFTLQKLMTLPPNKYLTVENNKMMVKPFGLFPPPRINGVMSDILVGERMIRLSFAGQPIKAPESDARNYVYVKGGSARFGNFQMSPSNILLTDADPNDPFSFSLSDYAKMIPKSNVQVKDTHTARVTMPDWQ